MNELFSERYGYVVKALQYETLNKITRNHLWDEIYTYILATAEQLYTGEFDENVSVEEQEKRARQFYYKAHQDFFGMSYYDAPKDLVQINRQFKNIVLNIEWYHCFDAIEALIRLSQFLFPNDEERTELLVDFTDSINYVFEDQKCAYRLVNGLIMPNTNNIEIASIAQALEVTDSIETVNTHLIQAIKHYSNREHPNYRSAVHESISALESLLLLITKLKKGTMSDALKTLKLKDDIGLSQALQESLTKLYGWASDEIRHSMKPGSEIDIDDAKMIIVTCCNFVTYLISKSIKSGINLE